MRCVMSLSGAVRQVRYAIPPVCRKMCTQYGSNIRRVLTEKKGTGPNNGFISGRFCSENIGKRADIQSGKMFSNVYGHIRRFLCAGRKFWM